MDSSDEEKNKKEAEPDTEKKELFIENALGTRTVFYSSEFPIHNFYLFKNSESNVALLLRPPETI
ncbi:hypothetical protein [Allomuricauda sp. d1]|uniref:hypothetical protein n=1 Tax=Allomuricauda sp. d1 TaxID=3136725 RepID=UPI0031CF1255